MAKQETASKPRSASPYLVIPEDGEPYLRGSKCSSCGAIYVGTRDHCGNCAGVETMKPVHLGNRGKLYSFCIVHRSFPGIDVPYISAIVDLEGGGSIKGNLIGVEPKPENVRFDMDVNVVFEDALGRRDAEGNSYMSYFFRPA